VTERRGAYVSDREGMGTWNYSYRENDFLETWWHKVKKILWSYLNGSGVKSLFAVPCHQFRDFQRCGVGNRAKPTFYLRKSGIGDCGGGYLCILQWGVPERME